MLLTKLRNFTIDYVTNKKREEERRVPKTKKSTSVWENVFSQCDIFLTMTTTCIVLDKKKKKKDLWDVSAPLKL